MASVAIEKIDEVLRKRFPTVDDLAGELVFMKAVEEIELVPVTARNDVCHKQDVLDSLGQAHVNARSAGRKPRLIAC